MVLDISHNQFEGTISRNIRGLRSLEELVMNGNNFTGPLPRAMCDLGNATVIMLQNNAISGRLPRRIEELYLLGQSCAQERA